MDKVIQLFGGFDGYLALTEEGRIYFKKYGSRQWLEEPSPIPDTPKEQGQIKVETPKERKERLAREVEEEVWGKKKN